MAWINACGSDNVIISIQGLVSVIERYYYAGLDSCSILANYTLRDCIRGGILQGRKRFKQSAEIERNYLNNVKHVIGRTEWDRIHVYSVNPEVSYHFCNETLRDSFYIQQWNIDECHKFTIQCPASTYPIKGLHVLLRALSIVKQYYPTVILKIPGWNITNTSSFRDRLRFTGYGKYIKRLIAKYELSENVRFLGVLDEVSIAEELTKSHLFICPSAIENSSNSLCEAQLVGVPCIASIAGGATTLISHETSGLLYRFEEYEQLAYYILILFNDLKYAERLSLEGRKEAVKRHSKEDNANRLIDIYNLIMQ